MLNYIEQKKKKIVKIIRIACIFFPIISAFLPMDQFLLIGTVMIIIILLNIREFMRALLFRWSVVIFLFALLMGFLAYANNNFIGLIAVFFMTLIIIYVSFLRKIITKPIFEILMLVIALGSLFSLYYCSVNFYSTSTYLLYEYFIQIIHIPFSYVVGIAKGVESSSTFIQPNYYGHLSALIALICLFYILSSTREVFQKHWPYVLKLIFYILILLVNLYALQLTQSRSAYIGLAFGTLIMVLVFDVRLFIGLSIPIMILILTKYKSIISFFPRIETIPKDGQYRIGLFKSAIEEIRLNWLLGKGFYTYPLVYQKYQSTYEIHVHNIFLEVLMDSGLVGISILVAYYSTYIKRPIKDWVKRNKEYLPLVCGTLALEAANGMTDAVLVFPQSFLFLSIILLSLELNDKPRSKKVLSTKDSLDNLTLTESNQLCTIKERK